MLAKAIQKYGRDKFFICTKVPASSPKINEKGELQMNPIPATKENILKFC